MTWRGRLFARRPRLLGVVGILLTALTLYSVAKSPPLLSGWLAAFVFWSSLPIGALVFVMMIRLIPGIWSELLGKPAEDAMLLLPLALLAVLPILIGAGAIYGWMRAPTAEGFRGVYLTQAMFTCRTILFFAFVILLAALLLLRRSWSTSVASIGLIIVVPFHTMVTVDWLASRDAAFHASGFGLYVLSIQVQVALCILIMIALGRSRSQSSNGILGALLLTSLLLWAYFAFMQYFISWSNNLPPIVAWYQRRGEGGWGDVEWLIGILGLLPAFLLLFSPIRCGRRWLIGLCLLVLYGKALEIAWLTLPEERPTTALDVFAALRSFFGLGLIVLAARSFMPRVGERLRQRLIREEATS